MKKLIALALFVVGITFVGCVNTTGNSNLNPLVGTWGVGNQPEWVYTNTGLFQDVPDKASGTYTNTANVITLTYTYGLTTGTKQLSYNISGYTLTLGNSTLLRM